MIERAGAEAAGAGHELVDAAARDQDYELLDLLPTHRSQITYWHRNRRCVLHPDASFQLSCLGDWHHCLPEFERRAVTPKRVPERLRGYLRYPNSGYAQRDHGGLHPLVLFVFETSEAEETFLNVHAKVRHAPFASSHLDALKQHGVLGEAWRLPPPEPPVRWYLHAV